MDAQSLAGFLRGVVFAPPDKEENVALYRSLNPLEYERVFIEYTDRLLSEPFSDRESTRLRGRLTQMQKANGRLYDQVAMVYRTVVTQSLADPEPHLKIFNQLQTQMAMLMTSANKSSLDVEACLQLRQVLRDLRPYFCFQYTMQYNIVHKTYKWPHHKGFVPARAQFDSACRATGFLCKERYQKPLYNSPSRSSHHIFFSYP